MKYSAAFLVLACLWLGGCGQTGPLYLPQGENPATEAAAEPQNQGT